MPPEIALALAADLLDAYANNHALAYGGQNYSAAQVKEILDNVNIFTVPCVNPDGREFTMAVNDAFHRDWRRNRNTSYHGTASCQGVDLNRNYDIAFDLGKHFLAIPDVLNFTSDDPCHFNQVYHTGRARSPRKRPATSAGC